MNTAISIILPVKNGEEHIKAAIESCLQQTLSDFELLIINDHSTDNTLAICKEFKDGRLLVITNTGDGLVDALNTGLKRAKTPFIARMDADDLMHPMRLQKQKDYLLKHEGITVIGSQVRLFPEEAIQGGFQYFIDWQNRLLSTSQLSNQIFVETPLTHPSVMFRSKEILAAGGYRNGDFPEDYELWLRLDQLGHKFAKLPEILLDWRESTTRLSRTAKNCRREAFDVLRAEYLDLKIPLNRKLVICGAGRRTRQRCAHILNKGNMVSAWVDIDPNKIGQKIDRIPVIAIHSLAQLRPKPFVLNYVSQRGAREKVEESLLKLGYLAEIDFYSVG